MHIGEYLDRQLRAEQLPFIMTPVRPFANNTAFQRHLVDPKANNAVSMVWAMSDEKQDESTKQHTAHKLLDDAIDVLKRICENIRKRYDGATEVDLKKLGVK